MKMKLIIACSVAVAMASCSKKEPATSTEEKPVIPVEVKPAPVVVEEVAPTAVSKSLKGLTYALEGDKFVNQDVSNETEYFLVYFSASW